MLVNDLVLGVPDLKRHAGGLARPINFEEPKAKSGEDLAHAVRIGLSSKVLPSMGQATRGDVGERVGQGIVLEHRNFMEVPIATEKNDGLIGFPDKLKHPIAFSWILPPRVPLVLIGDELATTHDNMKIRRAFAQLSLKPFFLDSAEKSWAL